MGKVPVTETETIATKEYMRVKIIKDYKEYKRGQVVEVTRNIAHGLIDSGVASLTKDMVSFTDYSTKALKTPVNRSRKQNG